LEKGNLIKMANTEHKRQIVIPGETIVEGDNYLPGDGTEKQGNKIVAFRYGLAEESNKLVKVIPLSGVYQPRRGNVIIGKCNLITFNGWVIDIGTAENAFLPLMETPRFVSKDRLDEVLRIGDLAVVQILGINGRGVDLTIKERGLGRIDDGIVFKINSNKVPRVIGKEGSMIRIIRSIITKVQGKLLSFTPLTQQTSPKFVQNNVPFLKRFNLFTMA
jgi:exosome complex component RRP4